ncbi:MAG TPA: YbdK family carboxylate-amine ligase [Solirubrobacterales bacterium]|nr:YbdK family carboxylate-amine ligase [Solirubrobacterales bacterium]
MDHRFGATAPLSLGVEEELLLVDDELQLDPAAEQVLAELDDERVSTEIFAGQIEIKTGVCAGPDEALRELAELRRAVAATGAGLLAAGVHPADATGRAQLVSKPRYAPVAKDFGSLLRTPPCGLHVHVGMPDPETAIRVANALRRHLPLLQALTANSPFMEGADSGHASARTAAVVSSYPRFEMPREFRDFEEFREVADQLIAAAGVDDYTYIWWDVRPHPNLGTVEVRAVDVQTDVAASVAVAALIQAIAAKEIDRPNGSGPVREALEESYFQAARYGLEAELLADGGTALPARELARATLDEVRPYAAELGTVDAIGEVERVLREGNGADEQHRVHEAAGMDGLLAYLAATTLPA